MRQPKFFGVYSLSTGWTDNRRKTLFFVWELPDGAFAVQELDSALQPRTAPERISVRAFSKNFLQEPEILAMPMAAPDPAALQPTPAPQPVPSGDGTPRPAPTAAAKAAPPKEAPHGTAAPRTAARTAARLRVSASAPAAERPAARAGLPQTARPGATAVETPPRPRSVQAYDLQEAHQARLAEDNLRETFRQTLLRLKRPKDRKAALAALEQLAAITENITPVHKHMFRDFGVRLRQNALPDLALLFSRKAVELAPDDDHAHFNLARILCLLGQYDEAASHVRTAMHMDSQEPVYLRMLAHIRKEKLLHRGAKRPPTLR